MRTPTRYNLIGASMILVGAAIVGQFESMIEAVGLIMAIVGSNIDQASDQLEANRLKKKIYGLMGKGK